MYCYFCKEYISALSLYGSLCDYCSNLRRCVLLYKKPLINTILQRHLVGINLFEDNENTEKIDISLGDKDKSYENEMLQHQLERMNDDK